MEKYTEALYASNRDKRPHSVEDFLPVAKSRRQAQEDAKVVPRIT
jgi:hypothetical protein